jgi:cytochrome P450
MAEATVSQEQQHPPLVKVPAFPLIGSLVPQLSGIPMKHEQSKVFDFWPAMRAKYGPFYSFGLPGAGQGLYGTFHVIQDPFEMARLIRQEGAHPSGAAEFSWGLSKFYRDRKMAVGGLLHRGPSWKRVRSFVQTDLLSPAAAERYLPTILESAQFASRGAVHYAEKGDLNEYCNRASLDMFSSVMFGVSTRISNPTHRSDPVDVEFCHAAAEGLRLNSELMKSGYHALLNLGFGVPSRKYRQFEEAWTRVTKLSSLKVQEMRQARAAGTLTPAQQASYANQAMERQLQQDSKEADMFIDETEVDYIAGGLFSAGVDTTGGMLSWKLLHLAAHPEAQEKVHEELMQITSGTGILEPHHVSSTAMPYLYAVLRESHRLGNISITIPLKRFPNPITVHGVELPAGSVVALDTLSQSMDPALVGDDVREFKPERFLKPAVEARKGTPASVMDHIFFSGPFSQGARKCPGSRVANFEALALLAQLILDWKFELADPSLRWQDVPYDLQTVLCVSLPPMKFQPRKG